MSISSIAARSLDKGSDLSGQGFDSLDSDFFDQFLTFSPDPDLTVLPDLPFQEKSLCGSHSADKFSSSQNDEVKQSGLDYWQGGEPCSFSQNAASSHHNLKQENQLYSESSGRAAISDSELLSLEGITLLSPQIPTTPDSSSLPSSPTHTSTTLSLRRNRLAESASKKFKRVTGGLNRTLHSPIRKTAQPTMMRASQYSQNNFDAWGHKPSLDSSKFNFDFPQHGGPLSPPPSARVSDISDNSNTVVSMGEHHHDSFSYSNGLPQFPTRATDYRTPLTTPTLDAHHSRSTSLQQPSSDTMIFPPTPQLHHASASWSQMPTSSEYNPFGTAATYESEADAAPVWWNHAAAAPMAQPSPTGFYDNAQRATKSLAAQLQTELAYNANELAYSPSNIGTGLMIQMPDEMQQHSFIVAPSTMHQQQGYFGPTQTQHYHHSSQEYAHSRSRQMQITSPTLHNTRSRSSGSDCPSPKSSLSPAFHIRKRRTPSRKDIAPRTPSISGSVDFVNFTPNDSRKILTGVAPSGSSKTKARREKEAMEKRRRLSQAALRAVRAAGGDIESLVEEGLFV